MARLTILPAARHDLVEIGDFIASDEDVQIARILHGARNLRQIFDA